MRKYLLHILIIFFISLLTFITHATEEPRIILRSSYKTLSMEQVLELPYLVVHDWQKYYLRCHSRFIHNYHLKTINGDKVVVDNATKLMWHQSGSPYEMNWEQARRWLKVLNKNGYAGYYSWRLPTLEEAASLLEKSSQPSQTSGSLSVFLFGVLFGKSYYYIDPIFDKTQEVIFTGDFAEKENVLMFQYSVNFSRGSIDKDVMSLLYIRPVISIKGRTMHKELIDKVKR